MLKYQPLFAAFPDQAMVIRRAVLRESDFAAICDDYLACVSAIKHWAAAPDGEERVQEYERTLCEIKAEITEFLARNEPRQSHLQTGSSSASEDLGTHFEPPNNTEKH